MSVVTAVLCIYKFKKKKKKHMEVESPAAWVHSAGVSEVDSSINVTRHLYSSVFKFFLQNIIFESYSAAVKKKGAESKIAFFMLNWVL